MSILNNLRFINAKATSGAVEEWVVSKSLLPFIVNEPVAFTLNLYGETIAILSVSFLYSVLILFGWFWNEDSSNKTIMSLWVTLCFF